MCALKLEQQIQLGTDGASFLLYHPDDFPNRPGRPAECLEFDFAWKKEAKEGRIIAFCTGSDGQFSFRITSEGLTARERPWRLCSAEFLYTVRHGEMLIDNGCGYNQFWFELPNGHYRVTLNAIDWSAEPGAEDRSCDDQLPNYVVCFEPVADPSEVNAVPWPPRLDLGAEPTPAWGVSEANREKEEPLRQEYVLLVEPDLLVLPNAEATVEVSYSCYTTVFDGSENDVIVLAPTIKVPTLAALVAYSGSSRTGDGPWSIELRGKHLVTVTGHQKKGKSLLASIKPLERPRSRPKPDDLAGLKTAFARYAQSKPRGLHIDDLEFTLEKWEANESAEEFTWWLLAKLPVPPEERARLAVVSLADQINTLRAWLTSPDRTREFKSVRAATTHDREFLQAIIENPDDNGPRLVYADWLEEQGDPRGQFIRLQCELDELDDQHHRYKALKEQEGPLLREYGKEWQGLFAKLGLECTLRRGFVASAEMTVTQFLKRGEELFEQGPLTRLTLKPFDRRKRQEQMTAVAASSLLQCLERLTLSDNEITDGEISVLAASPHLKKLRSLWLLRNEIGTAGMKALADSIHLANLTSLSLALNPLEAAGAKALASSKRMQHLAELDLRNTGIGDAGIEALAASAVVQNLTSLSVDWSEYGDPIGSPITERGAAALAQSPYLGKLKSLMLRGNRIGDAGASALAKSQCLKSLAMLDLGDNHIGNAGAKALASSTRLASLADLDLGGTNNQIDDASAAALAKAPKLQRLNLFMNCGLSNAGKKIMRERFGKREMSGYDD